MTEDHAPSIPRALTIAGSDSGGGAGIQADLKTFAALGVYGMSAITAITAQNTEGVFAVHDVPPEIVAEQIDAVLRDIGADAAKTGMLSVPVTIEVVADRIRAWKLRVVVDPVMVAKGGAPLLVPAAVTTLRERLLPLAEVVTPNIPEAEALTGTRIITVADMRAAAAAIRALGPRAVVVKGGHRSAAPIDVYDDGEQVLELGTERIPTRHTHGTGCTFSSAIAAYLALGLGLPDAVRAAKDYITGAIAHAPGIGHGHGPVGHFWRYEHLAGRLAFPATADFENQDSPRK